MIGLEDIARMYAVLTDELERTTLPGQTSTFPRGAKILASTLSRYSNHTYKVEKDDFYTKEGVTEELNSIYPKDNDLYSVCIIHQRPTAADATHLPRRLVQIMLNTGLSRRDSSLILNYCWGRFCLVKEVCQAVLYESKDMLGNEYPITISFEEVGTLLSRINNEPFSLWDFPNENYGSELAVENAAELLANGLLFPFEDALDLQTNILDLGGEIALRTHNYRGIAEKYKIPRRYVEVIITWKGLPGLVADINRARAGVLK